MSGFDIQGISGGPFGTNAYIIIDEATRRCAVVDPGYDADKVWGKVIADKDLTLESIICTHGHIDHTCGVACLARAYPGVPVLIHKEDAAALTGGNDSSASFLNLPPFEPCEPTGFLEEGKPVSVGETSFEIYDVPGHCPGHVMLLNGKKLISGDVIFAGSIGRTDLPGGSYPTLAHSIVEKVMTLDDDVVIYPGHGPVTTVGQERRTNPFVLEMLAESS